MVNHNDIDNKDNAYKEKWLKVIKDYPEKTKTELRQINKKVYISLYRNNREWLNKNSPQLKSTININTKINWEQRDIEILDRVIGAVNDILVGDELGIRALLEKQLDKLPKTKEYLINHTECIRDFQVRRIKSAIKELEEEGTGLQLWRIYRKAGIRMEYQKELEDEIFSL